MLFLSRKQQLMEEMPCTHNRDGEENFQSGGGGGVVGVFQDLLIAFASINEPFNGKRGEK